MANDRETPARARCRDPPLLLEEALAHARSSGLKRACAQAAAGPAAQEIERIADEQSVGQIAIGTHGRAAMGSPFNGSVAQRVLLLGKVTELPVE